MTDNKCEYHKEDWPWVWAIRQVDILDSCWKKALTKEQKDEADAKSLKPPSRWTPPAQLTPYLYVGSMSDASYPDKLQKHGITHVLNVAGESANIISDDVYWQWGIERKSLAGEDEEGYPMLEKHFSEAFEFVEKVKHGYDNQNQSKKCLVHCQAGLNRSGLIACACLLMLEEKTNVLEIVMNLRRKRSSYALFNESFQEQLVNFARVNKRLGPKPGEKDCLVEQTAPPARVSYDGVDYDGDTYN